MSTTYTRGTYTTTPAYPATTTATTTATPAATTGTTGKTTQATGSAYATTPAIGDAKVVYSVTLAAEPSTVPATIRLRRFLKVALRAYGLRCVEVRQDGTPPPPVLGPSRGVAPLRVAGGRNPNEF